MSTKKVSELDEETFRKYLDLFLNDAKRRQIEIPTIAALRSELDTLKSLLKSLEWSNITDMGNFCPMCHAASHRGNHFYDCELEAALAGKE